MCVCEERVKGERQHALGLCKPQSLRVTVRQLPPPSLPCGGLVHWRGPAPDLRHGEAASWVGWR